MGANTGSSGSTRRAPSCTIPRASATARASPISAPRAHRPANSGPSAARASASTSCTRAAAGPNGRLAHPFTAGFADVEILDTVNDFFRFYRLR
jgi:hypothetical protein